MPSARRSVLVAAVAETAAPTNDGQPSKPVVFYNAQVFTAEYDHPYAEAVAIRGDRIIAVGSLGSVKRIAGPTARNVDLHGKFLMPGMIDAHVHPILGGITLIQANFSDTASVAALVQFVAEQRKRESMRGDVLVINDVKNDYWSHAAEIDAALSEGAFAERPIVLFGSDGGADACGHHAAVHPQPQTRRPPVLWVRHRVRPEWMLAGAELLGHAPGFRRASLGAD
jgi:predicted amidohydrolase YtcJ